MVHIDNATYGYSLSAVEVESGSVLRLLLHRRVVESHGFQLVADSSEVQEYIAELGGYGLQSFLHELVEESRFGFNGSFEVGRWEGDVLPLRVPIPTIEEEDGVCNVCGGEEPAECYGCSGSGKDYGIDHSRTLAISATFSVLLGRLRYHEIFRQAGLAQPPLQLLLVSTMTRAAAHGGSLSGVYSIPLATWLAKFPEYSTLPLVSKAMKLVHQKLHPFSHHLYNDHDFMTAVQRNGWLNITCPGDACGLHPHHHGTQPGYGYEFQCHNVDTADQQLVLLTALGALTDMAIAERVGQD